MKKCILQLENVKLQVWIFEYEESIENIIYEVYEKMNTDFIQF